MPPGEVNPLASKPAFDTPPIQDQPSASKRMIVPTPGGSRNPLMMLVDLEGKRDWSHGLFRCCDEPYTSALSCFFPCGLFAKTKSRFDALETTQHPSPDKGESDMIGIPCCLYCITARRGVACVWTFTQRQELQRRYNIKQDVLTDFLISWCCHCCALVQHAREVEAEEDSFAPDGVGA